MASVGSDEAGRGREDVLCGADWLGWFVGFGASSPLAKAKAASDVAARSVGVVTTRK